MSAAAPAVDAVAIANTNQARATDATSCVWVGASAGSGKTKVLVDRLLGLLLGGTDPVRILCLTFTKAAAAEMRVRVNGKLSEWAAFGDHELSAELAERMGHTDLDGITPDLRDRARQLFARVVDLPGGLRVMTIHAFCESVLRRFPVESGVAPHFEVLTERDAADLLAAAQQAAIAGAQTDTELAAALAIITGHTREDGFQEIISEYVFDRARINRLRADGGGIDGVIDATCAALDVLPGLTPEQVIAAACRETTFDRPGLLAAATALADTSGKSGKQAAGPIQAWLAAPESERKAGFSAYLNAFLNKDHEPRVLVVKAATKAGFHVLSAIQSETDRLLAILETRRKATVATATAALHRFGGAILDTYAARKAARALLDFDDLILETAAMFARPGVADWVMYKLDGGLDHLLIDEAQDTSPEQWGIVEALVGEFFSGEGAREISPALTRRTVFAVGDVKQSIYSFQRADPALFDAMRQRFRARATAALGRWDDVELHVSFRSGPPVLQAVDAVFADPVAALGVVADSGTLHHLAARSGLGGSVEVWPPLAPGDTPGVGAWVLPVRRVPDDSPRTRLARLIAARVADWLHNGAPLASTGAPMRARDVMVLVRRRGAFMEELVAALKQHGVPVAGVDRMMLTEQLAVMDLMALGQFLLLPDDDLTLATVLKGPFIDFTDEQLFDIAHARTGTLWAALSAHDGANNACGAACTTLNGLLRQVDFTRPFELFAGFLAAGGSRQLYRRLGPEAEDPVDEFLARALEYERTHAPSLEGFLHWLMAGNVEVVRELEHGGGGEDGGQVRVMTVHGAKGLQAPVVILPDTGQRPRLMQPLLWTGAATPATDTASRVLLWPPHSLDRDATCKAAYAAADEAQTAEYHRLLYVAMTRAAERLVICGWRTERRVSNSWYELVERALAPITQQVTDPFLAAHADECAQIRRLYQAPADQQTSPAMPAPQTLRPLPAWAREPAPREPAPPRPLVPSRAVAEVDGSADPPVRSPVLAAGRAALARGNVIHKLLQLLPEMPPDSRTAAARRFLALPGHDLASDQQAEILAELMAILDDPAFAALFGPGSQAEVPMTGVISGAGSVPYVVTGQVDRLVVLPGRVQVVDYKTSRPPPTDVDGIAPAYLRQLACYRQVLRGVYPGVAIECALLWTYAPRLMFVPDAMLTRHLPSPSPSRV